MRTTTVKANKRPVKVKREKESLFKIEEGHTHDQEKPVEGVSTCHNCGTLSRCRKRTFSDQAWAVLLLWNEIDPQSVDQAICEQCYGELRDILIDRRDEIEEALEHGDKLDKSKHRVKHLAS